MQRVILEEEPKKRLLSPQKFLTTYFILKQSKPAATPEFDVCVLIPCYNNTEGLLTSMDSISYYPDKLCVVVVDDGSTVPLTEEKRLREYSFPIYVLSLEKNAGITQALNAGLEWIDANLRVKYIARLDCADACHQDRFYKQVAFLDLHPEVGLLGSWCRFHNPVTNAGYTYTTPVTHEAILSEMHFRNVFIHPTVMFRTELLKTTGGYPNDYPLVEDYALFFRMLHKTKGAVIDEFLVTCEINPKGLSISNRKKQLEGRQRVVSEYGVGTVKKLIGNSIILILRVLPYGFILFLKNKLSYKSL